MPRKSRNGWCKPFTLEGFLLSSWTYHAAVHHIWSSQVNLHSRPTHLRIDSPTPWPVLTFALAFALAAFAFALALAFTVTCSRSCPRFGSQTWQWQHVEIFWSTVRPKFWDTPQPRSLTLPNGPLCSNCQMKSASDWGGPHIGGQIACGIRMH